MEDRLRTPQDRGNYCYWRRHVDCLWLVASADVTACSRPSSLNGVPFLKGLFSTPSPSKPFRGQGIDEGVGTIVILPQIEWSHNNQTWSDCSSKCLRSKLGSFLGHQKCKNMICCSCRNSNWYLKDNECECSGTRCTQTIDLPYLSSDTGLVSSIFRF